MQGVYVLVDGNASLYKNVRRQIYHDCSDIASKDTVAIIVLKNCFDYMQMFTRTQLLRARVCRHLYRDDALSVVAVVFAIMI